MKTKLTLSVDKDLIEFARKEANSQNTTISKLFSEELQRKKNAKSKPTVKEMAGIFKGTDIDYSKAGIRKAYAEKYLHRS